MVRKNASTAIDNFLSRACVSYTSVDSLQQVPQGWVSFAVSRNPYDRCVSAWKHCPGTHDRTLLDCLTNPPQPGDTLITNHDYIHFTKTQSDFMFGDGLSPTHILRFENLEEDLYNMFKTYNFSREYLGELNKMNIGNYSYQLNDCEREAIYQFYKEDFDKLGYNK